MTVCFSAAQTWCPFHSAHILLQVNVRNDDAAAEEKSITLF